MVTMAQSSCRGTERVVSALAIVVSLELQCDGIQGERRGAGPLAGKPSLLPVEGQQWWHEEVREEFALQ